MRTIPRTIEKRIEFFEQHIEQWTANAEALGLSAEVIEQLGERLVAARSASDTANTLRQQAKNATTTQNTALDSLMELGSAVVATIRAKAKLAGHDPSIYSAANLSPARTPAPLPPPEPAQTITTALRNSGAIELAWEGTIAHGTCYTIWRQIGDSTPPVLLGAVGAKSFLDETLPAGTPEATYFLRTHRGTATSDDSTHVTVRLGVAGRERTDETRRTAPDGPLAAAA